jgi:large subunit ribosomal protein L24
MKLKKGDKVMVIAGKARGEQGTITRVLTKENKVVLDGINLVKRHRRPTQQARKGQIIDMPMPIHASNVMVIDPKSGKPSRISIKRDDKGNRTRLVKSGQELK